jgi:ubiquinone/menaquinone biosynthesis C-methylase UbiE
VLKQLINGFFPIAMSTSSLKNRHENEREHGRKIAENADKVWGQETRAGRIRVQGRANSIVKATGMGQNMNVLDLGCGTGNYTTLFADTNANVTGIDLSEDLLQIAKQRVPSAKFLCTDAESLESIESGSMDCVVGNAVLHHFDVSLALRSMLRVLKPGGAIGFTEPNMLNPQIALQKNIPFLKKLLGDSPDETAFIRFKFIKTLKNAGFEEIKIIPFDFLHPWTPGFLVTPVRAISSALERIPVVQEIAGSLLISARKPDAEK